MSEIKVKVNHDDSIVASSSTISLYKSSLYDEQNLEIKISENNTLYICKNSYQETLNIEAKRN